MRLMKLSVPLAVLALAAVACDGDNTAGTTMNAGDTENDPYAGVATQPAPNTATQAAPNTATQAAPNTATQATQSPAASPGSSGSSTAQQCATVCSHIVAMECLEPSECAALCPAFEATGACQSYAQALATCAMAAADCNALDACETQADALDTCMGGGASTPTAPPSTTKTPTISNPGSCYTSNSCAGCTTNCDSCVCVLQAAGSSSAAITTSCASLCTSS